MALRLLPVFSSEQLGTLKVAVVESTGGTFTLEMPDGRYCHESVSAYAWTSDVQTFSTALKAALEAQNGSARTYTVTYNTSTGKYTIAIDGGTMSLTFSTQGEGGANMQAVLGMTGDRSAASSLSSQAKCYFVWHGTTGSISDNTDDQDEGAYSAEVVTASGKVYGTSPLAWPTMHDWTIPHELKANTHKSAAASASPWTLEHLFEHCRCHTPFLRVFGSESLLHQMRAGFDAWKPRRVFPAVDDYYNVSMGTRIDRL